MISVMANRNLHHVLPNVLHFLIVAFGLNSETI